MIYRYNVTQKAKALREIFQAIESVIDVESKEPLNHIELMRQVMQATNGHYNPSIVRAAIKQVL